MIGTLPPKKQRDVMRTLTAMVSDLRRVEAEMVEGWGPHRLAARLGELDLPTDVTVVLRPTLAFLHADLCIIAPKRLLLINALHWKGLIQGGEKEKWFGGKGTVDLGRPDRRARLFCDKLAYSGLAAGFSLEPIVLFTAGPVEFKGGDPEATLVQWDQLEPFIRQRLAEVPAGAPGDVAGLIKAIGHA